MESSIGEFPNIGKFPTLHSPDKSGKNSPALRTNSEIFQGEPLRGEFIENVWGQLLSDSKQASDSLSPDKNQFNIEECQWHSYQILSW